MVGQLITRSGRVRTTERPSTVPFVFTITPQAYAKWEDVRDVVEGITFLDRTNISFIDFGVNATTNINWVNEYQGALTLTQQNALRVSTSTGYLGYSTFDTTDITGYSTTATFDYMRLTNLPSIGATMADGSLCSTATVVFAPGDWIQFRTLTNGTADRGLCRTIPLTVYRGSGTTVDVPLHRPFVWEGTSSYTVNSRAGADISIGQYVRIGVYITKVPDFKLLPGKLVEWTGDFELYEYVSG
jgi:hypothetical protein